MDKARATRRLSNKRKAEEPPHVPLTPQRFHRDFQEYCSLHGISSKLIVEHYGTPVDLGKLHHAVTAAGGPEAVTHAGTWDSLIPLVGGLSPAAELGGSLQSLYQTHLEAFDRHRLQGPDPSQLTRSLRPRKLDTISAGQRPRNATESTVIPGSTEAVRGSSGMHSPPLPQRTVGSARKESAQEAVQQSDSHHQQGPMPPPDSFATHLHTSGAKQEPALRTAIDAAAGGPGREDQLPATATVKMEPDGSRAKDAVQPANDGSEVRVTASAGTLTLRTEVHGGTTYVPPFGHEHTPPVARPPAVPDSPPRKRRLRASTLAQDPTAQQPPLLAAPQPSPAATPRSDGQQPSEWHNSTAYITPRINVESPPPVTSSRAPRPVHHTLLAQLKPPALSLREPRHLPAAGDPQRGRGRRPPMAVARGRGRPPLLGAGRGSVPGRARPPPLGAAPSAGIRFGMPRGRPRALPARGLGGARSSRGGISGRALAQATAGWKAELIGRPAPAVRKPESAISYVRAVVADERSKPAVVAAQRLVLQSPGSKAHTALREVLSWLRCAARVAGKMPETSKTLRGAVLRARDSRVSDPTPELIAFRRSGRVRHAPTAFVPTDQRRIRETVDPAEMSDMREGSEFQARTPELRLRPKQPSPRDRRWLQPPLLAAGSYGPATHPAPLATHPVNPYTYARSHVVWVHGSRVPMMVPHTLARNLGLNAMGIADAVDWTAAELDIYGRAMDEFQRPWGPGFRALLPGKSQERAAALYYNVWKRSVIPYARAWHERQRQEQGMRAMAVSAARAAARQEAAKRNAAAAAAAQQAQVQGQQRLQLRETVTWLQSLGRLPSSALLSRTRMERRASKAGQALATTNCWQLMSPTQASPVVQASTALQLLGSQAKQLPAAQARAQARPPGVQKPAALQSGARASAPKPQLLPRPLPGSGVKGSQLLAPAGQNLAAAPRPSGAALQQTARWPVARSPLPRPALPQRPEGAVHQHVARPPPAVLPHQQLPTANGHHAAHLWRPPSSQPQTPQHPLQSLVPGAGQAPDPQHQPLALQAKHATQPPQA